MSVFIVLLDFSPFIYLILTAAAIHELGHLAAMYICGVKIDRITVYPFGLDIRVSPRLISYKRELLIKSAGIAVNIIAALCCLPFNAVVFLFANITLALLNIIPITSLDGGGILEIILSMRLDPMRVTVIMKAVSFVFIVILWVIAVYVLFYTNYNFSLLILCIYLFVSIFLNAT